MPNAPGTGPPIKAATGTTPTSQLKLDTYRPSYDGYLLKMLVFSPPGAGKTTLAGTAEDDPRSAPVIVGTIESGDLALIERPVPAGPGRSDFKFVRKQPPECYGFAKGKLPDNATDVQELSHRMDRFERLYHFLRQGRHGFHTVVLDTLSELHRANLNLIVGRAAVRGKRESMFESLQKDWGENMNYLMHWLRKYRDLPMHVIVTCHSEIRERPDKSEKVQPFVNKAMVEPLCGLFDVVGYLQQDQRVVLKDGKPTGKAVTFTKLITEPITIGGIRIEAKDRSPGGKIGRMTVNPTITKLLDAIQSDKSATAEKAEATLDGKQETTNVG